MGITQRRVGDRHRLLRPQFGGERLRPECGESLPRPWRWFVLGPCGSLLAGSTRVGATPWGG